MLLCLPDLLTEDRLEKLKITLPAEKETAGKEAISRGVFNERS